MAAHAPPSRSPGPPAYTRSRPCKLLASCTRLFAGGQAPALLNANLAERTSLLFFRACADLVCDDTRGAPDAAGQPVLP